MALKTSKQAWIQIKSFSHDEQQVADLASYPGVIATSSSAAASPNNINKLPSIHQETTTPTHQQISNAVF